MSHPYKFHKLIQIIPNIFSSSHAYVGGAVVITAASAAAIFRSPALLNLIFRTPGLSVIVAVMIATLMIGHIIFKTAQLKLKCSLLQLSVNVGKFNK